LQSRPKRPIILDDIIAAGGVTMTKVTMGPGTLVYPMPAFLVGVDVDNKPNFITIAWSGIASGNPPMISVALRHHRYSYKGVKQTGTFSVNMPSSDLTTETDYCGIVSGSKSDKVATCHFKVFYGKLGNAPMIEQCPLNLECTVVHILNLGSHALIVGRIEESHITENCLTNDKPDINKIKPILYSEGPDSQYRAFGETIATAFHVGRKLKTEDEKPAS
jgi:flavin reductase (DIM6/NTAB) family NADH-FMN oxidoreductase RutF